MANNFQITISAIDKTTEVVRKINAQVDKMMAPFDRLSKSVNSLGKEAGANRLAKGLTSVGESAAAAGDKIRGIVAPLMAVIGVGSIAGVTALAMGLGRVQVALSNQATSIGMSTQELQKWQGAAKLAGLSSEDMTGALSNVGEKLDNAFRTPETLRDMNTIGIQMHRLENGSINTARALEDIAEAMEKQGNVETKKRIADAFGLSAIFPLLVKGKAAVRDFYKESERTTKIFTPAEIEQGLRYQQQVQSVERSFDSLKNSLGVAVLPAFERVIGAVGRLVEKYGDVISSKVAEYAERLANWIDRTDWAKVATDVGKMVDELGGVKKVALVLAALTFATPIAGLVSMVVQAGKLALLLAPIFANPLVLGAMALVHSKDLNEGEQDELDRRRAGLPGQTAGAAASPLTSPVTIDQRKAALIAKMQADGYSNAQIAGTVGSLMQESALDPKAVNSSSGAAGIAQWLGPRKAEFERQYGKRVQDSSFDEQVNYMLWELNNTEKRSGSLLRRADTPEKAAQIHAWEYERPGVAEANIAKRQTNAAGIYAAIAGNGATKIAAVPAGASSAPQAGASGQNNAAPTQMAQAGTVQVNVKFESAPKGTTTSVTSTGNVKANVTSSVMLEGQV